MSSFLTEHKNNTDIITYLAHKLRKTDNNKRKCQCTNRILRTGILPTELYLVHNTLHLMCTFTHPEQMSRYPNRDHSGIGYDKYPEDLDDCDRYSG